jgi:hypothetical protein
MVEHLYLLFQRCVDFQIFVVFLVKLKRIVSLEHGAVAIVLFLHILKQFFIGFFLFDD